VEPGSGGTRINLGAHSSGLGFDSQERKTAHTNTCNSTAYQLEASIESRTNAEDQANKQKQEGPRGIAKRAKKLNAKRQDGQGDAQKTGSP
jgi:hypothetical protein